MLSITKEFHFSASHQLSGLRQAGPPVRPTAGPTYVVMLD
ncbi:hypothetical protein SALBM311S_02577 [Streptomyces alboniger]